MSKCNNCTKFLTCNREGCNQVTYLRAGQIYRVEAEKTNIFKYDYSKKSKLDINSYAELQGGKSK